jgi:hypothetical protein
MRYTKQKKTETAVQFSIKFCSINVGVEALTTISKKSSEIECHVAC